MRNTFTPILRPLWIMLLAACLPAFSWAQKNITVTVYQVSTNIGDCDGFLGGNSDPAWWWTGGSISNRCLETTCNGCTIGTSQQLFNSSFNCIGDVPSGINITFNGCEDDGPGCTLGAFLGICDGSSGSRTDFVTLPTASGTTFFGPFAVNSNCGTGGTQYQYWGRIDVTGTFISTPVNDNLCNATNIPVGSTVAGNSTCSTVQPGEVDPSSGSISPTGTIWYMFTAPPSGHVIVSTDYGGTSYDTEIAVYRSAGVPCPGSVWGALAEVGSNDDKVLVFNLKSEVEMECLKPGVVYYIQVDGDDASDFGSLQISVVSVGPPIAANDDVCAATNLGALPLGGVLDLTNQNNICATVEPGEYVPSSFSLDQTVWYRFTTGATVGANTLIEAIDNGSDDIDLQLALYTTSTDLCTGVFTEYDSDYDLGFFSEDLNIKCLPPNETFWLQVDGSYSFVTPWLVEGDFEIKVTDDGNPQPTNDDRCSPLALGTIPTLGSVFRNNDNNYCSGVEPGEPDPSSWDLDQTVWYTFKPPPSGSVEIELLTQAVDNIDLQLAVWESDDNTCTGYFSEIDSYDNPLSWSITGGNKMRLKCLDTSKTYWIQVDGWPEPITGFLVEGVFDMTVNDYNVSRAPNDSVCDAIPLGDPSGGSVSALNQNNFCADNILEPVPSAFGTNMTVWYSFIAPSTGRVVINGVSDPLSTGDYIDLQLAVFAADGDSCEGSKTEIYSEYNDLLEWPPLSRDEEMEVTCLEPGRIYWLMVDGSDDPDDVDGWFNITVTEVPGPPPITNDDLCDATYLGAVPVGGSVGNPNATNFCATVEAGESVPSSFDIDQTVWFSFRAPATGNVTINLESDPLGLGDDIELQVAVYESSTDSCDGILTEVDSDYDPLAPLTFDEDLTITCLEPGKLYFVQIDGALPPWPLDVWVEGYFGLDINEDPAFPMLAASDSICNSIFLGNVPVGGATPILATANYCATEEAGEPNVTGGVSVFDFLYDETVWYHFTTSATPGTVTVSITGASGIDANIHVYQALTWPSCSFADLAEVGNADDIFSFNTSLDIPCIEANTTYYVQVDGFDLIGDYGTFNIQVTDNGLPVPSAPNDTICGAIPLGVVPAGGTTATVSGNNFCAGEEVGEPNVSGITIITSALYDETVWYTFTTSATPGTTTIDVFNTVGINATIAVYSVSGWPSCSFTDLTEVDSYDDLLSNNVSLPLTCLFPNTTYYVQIDGVDFLGDNGTFDIRVRDTGPAAVFSPEDSICDAHNLGVVPVGGSTPVYATNNLCSFEEPGELNVSGLSIVTDINYDETTWYTFTTSGTPGGITISITAASGINANIHVYEVSGWPTCAFTDLTEISNADDAFSNNVSLFIDCLKPNRTYYVQVDGDDLTGNEGTFNIAVTDDGTMTAFPVNDSICDAINLGTLTGGGTLPTYAGHNFCAGEEPGEPNVSGGTITTLPSYDETVWFSFVTPPVPGTITIAITGTTPGGLDGVLNLYLPTPSASCNFTDLQWIQSRTTTTFGNVSMTVTCLVPNTRYYVQVDGLDITGDMGTFNITVSDNGIPLAAPAYDLICNAVALGTPAPVAGPVAGNNFCAGVEAGEPGVASDDETVWYRFIAPASGSVTIDVTSVSGIDANFSLYHAGAGCSFAGLTQIGSNHDNLVSFSVSASEDCLIPGATYYVQIDGGDIFGDYGNFTIRVTDNAPAFSGPPNDPCSGAITLPIGTEPCQGSGLWNIRNYGNSTVSYIDTTLGCGTNCCDIWFQFTMPASGNVLVEGNDEYGFLGLANSELTIVAYTGSCGALVPYTCDQGGLTDDPIFYVSAPPGTVIYLQVFDDDCDAGAVNFGICLTDRCGSDNCITSTPMFDGITYCWDVDGANGEDVPSVPGYSECGDGSDPGHSVYFNYINTCPTFRVTITANIGNICALGEPLDGLSWSIWWDSTMCDDNPDTLLDCQQTDICMGATWFFSKVYSGIPVGTQHVLQFDGFDFTGDDNGTIRIDPLCPLAVEWLAFNGWHEEFTNQLSWKVGGDCEDSRFKVQKSTDGTHFSDIGSVDGGDFLLHAPGEATYGFTDHAPAEGHNYYRLIEVDYAGMETMSEVIDIFVNGAPGTQIVGLYPNPAHDQVHLDFFAGISGTYRITVTDMAGHVLINRTADLASGVNGFDFNLNQISAGMYIISVQSLEENLRDQERFIKD